MFSDRAISRTTARVTPGEDEVVRRVRPQLAVEHADDVRVRSFRHDAVAHHDRFDRAALGRGLLRQHVRQQLDRLDVAAQPANVGHGDALGATLAGVFRRDEPVHRRVDRRRHGVRRENDAFAAPPPA